MTIRVNVQVQCHREIIPHQGSKQWPLDYKSVVLPIELIEQTQKSENIVQAAYSKFIKKEHIVCIAILKSLCNEKQTQRNV